MEHTAHEQAQQLEALAEPRPSVAETAAHLSNRPRSHSSSGAARAELQHLAVAARALRAGNAGAAVGGVADGGKRHGGSTALVRPSSVSAITFEAQAWRPALAVPPAELGARTGERRVATVATNGGGSAGGALRSSLRLRRPQSAPLHQAQPLEARVVGHRPASALRSENRQASGGEGVSAEVVGGSKVMLHTSKGSNAPRLAETVEEEKRQRQRLQQKKSGGKGSLAVAPSLSLQTLHMRPLSPRTPMSPMMPWSGASAWDT
eukprot:SAG11_NODE_275_length_11309_cov_6.090901_5_plen_263_part_00